MQSRRSHRWREVIRDLGMEFLQAPVLEGGTMFQVLQKSGDARRDGLGIRS